jgi:hypothetical protein
MTKNLVFIDKKDSMATGMSRLKWYAMVCPRHAQVLDCVYNTVVENTSISSVSCCTIH